MASQNTVKGSDLYGAFAEVKRIDEQDINFARSYFDPIHKPALAYTLLASRYYHSSQVVDAVHIAFAYTGKHVYPDCPKPGNWWVWGKQIPDYLCKILVLVHKELAQQDKEYIISILDYLLGKGPIPGSGFHTGKASKDALNFFKVGVLTKDRTRIAHA